MSTPITETVPNVDQYTGAIPDRVTMNPDAFANAVHPYMNFFNADFVPQLEAIVASLNTLTPEINVRAVEVENAAVIAEQSATATAADVVTTAENVVLCEAAVSSIPAGTINDAMVSATTVWSSLKTQTEIVANSDKGALTHSFLQNESVAINLSAPVTTAIVSVQKEITQTGTSTNEWDILADGSNYNIEDFSHSTSITPSNTAGYITLTLGAGSFIATDIRKTISLNNGKAVLLTTAGSALVVENLDNANLTPAGSWKMEAIDFDTSGAKLSSFGGNVPSGGTGLLSYTGNGTKVQEFDNGDIALFSRNGTAQSATCRIRIIKRDGNEVLASTNVATSIPQYKVYRFGSNNIMFYNSTTFNIINSLGIVSSASTIVNSYTASFGVSGGTLPNGNVWTAGYNGTSNALVIHEYQDNGISIPTITQLTGTLGHNDVQRLPSGNFMVFYSTLPNRYMTILDSVGNIVSASTILNLGANADAFATISGVFENGNVILVYRYDSGTAVLRYVIYDKDGNEVKAPSIIAPLHEDKYKCELMADGRIAVYYKVTFNKIAVAYITSDGNSVIEETVSTDNVPSSQSHDAFKYSDGSLIFTFLNKYQFFDYKDNYVLNQHTSLITNQASQIDSTYFTDIISMTTVEEANGQEINYAFSTDDKTTWIVLKTIDGQRSIVRDNGGTWEYNSNATYSATTWTPATTNNQFQALSEAMNITSNKMNKTQLESVQDNEFFTLTNTIDSAIILFTNDGTATPIAKDIIMNYDANTLNKSAVSGVDYEYDQPTTTQVRIKSLAKNNLKIRVL